MVKLLIADADPASVFAMKRLVTRDLGCSTVEVDNGLDALHELSRQCYAGLLLAGELPGISAREVIASVRSCPDTHDLPIVVLTAERSEDIIRELGKLGVRHCLAKPLDPAYAKSRLRTILDDPQTRASRERRANTDGGLELEDGAPVLVADADPDFRHFFTSVLGRRFRVQAASSGAEALKMAAAGPPAVVCAGDHLGPLDRSRLAPKIRELRAAPSPRFLAIAGRASADDLRASGLFDGVLTKTFVPQKFLEQFEGYVPRPTSLRRLVAQFPDCRGCLLSATEQTCGMLMGIDLEPISRTRPSGPGFTAIVDLAVQVQDQVLGLRCSIGAAASGAAFMASQMLGVPDSELSDADLSSVVGELANIITGRIQNALQERALPTRCGLPQLRDERGALPSEPRGMTVIFGIRTDAPFLSLDLVGTDAPDPELAKAVIAAARAAQPNDPVDPTT